MTIDHALPHIDLELGSTLNDSGSPSIKCAVDTLAVLSTGNFHYFATIVKHHPECVKRIYVPEDYAPIILSGIVQREDQVPITTELNVGFDLHMPYCTRDGTTTSVAFATGPHVSVNALLGKPFLKATGLILDLNDDKVQLKKLDCGLFNIEYKRTCNTAPVMEQVAVSHLNGRLCDIVEIVTRLEEFILGYGPGALAYTHSFASSDVTLQRWVPPRTSMIDSTESTVNHIC